MPSYLTPALVSRAPLHTPVSCLPNFYTIASDVILKKATAIEATVLVNHNDDAGKDYKGKIRSLFLNLKDKSNPGLRANIVSGELSVSKFCTMSSQVRSCLFW